MRKRSQQYIALSLALVGAAMLLWLPELAFAQTLPETGLSDFAAQAGFGGTSDIRVIIARLIRTVLSLAGIVLLVMIIYGGFKWITAGGAQDKIDKARQTIFQAIVGLIIVLSAFAITQFVIGSLLDATGATSTTSSTTGPGIPGCPTCPVDTSNLFVTESWGCLENLSVLPQNVQTQILFNRNVQTDPAYLASFVRVAAGSSSVDVNVNGAGQVVTITPNASTCPAEAGNVFCPGTNYTVTVGEGFESADGVEVDCTVLNPCSYSFTTSNVIDTEGPAVALNLPLEGAPVFSFTPLDLQATVTDDSGVGVTDFTVNSAYVDSAAPTSCSGDGPMSCMANGTWTPGSLVIGSSHVIRATAIDCSGNTATSSPVTVTALAPHCSNGVLDEDETGIDCGGADCLACVGSSCTTNAECSSLLCVDGECVLGPQITSVAPRDESGIPNGAPGNFITISGTGFGVNPGLVTFLGAVGDDGDNQNASVVSCPAPAWSDTQIVVAVPAGAVTGAIQVTTGAVEPLVDATDDTFGPLIADFEVNTTVRPGLCSVIPDTGEVADRITIAGANFGTDPAVGEIYFDGVNVYEATFLPSIDFWSDSSISVLVPPSTAGEYDLSVFVDDEGSNTLAFEVTEVTTTTGLPRIDYVDSGVALCEGDIAFEGDLCADDTDCGTGTCEAATTTGGPGQYVTIFGDNFGSATGTVLFNDDNSGDVTFVPDFPPQCGGNWWSDTQIVVQVPASLSTSPLFNPKTIRVQTADYPTTPESNTATFTVDAIDVTPGLCAVSPTAGPTGTPVTLYGDNLGSSAADFEIRFYDGVALPPSVAAPAATETYTSDQEIGAQVPVGAAAGATAAYVTDISSNTLNFQVGDCNVIENLCSTSQVCCSSGICANNISECSGDVADAQYVYTFTTGPIPTVPTVIEQCNSSYISPSPSTLWEEGLSTCVNGNVMAAFNPGLPSTAMDTVTLEDSDNVFVDQCIGDGLDPCEVLLTTDEGDPLHVEGVLSATPTSVSFDPDVNFEIDTWYQVTLTTDVLNDLDVALAEPYVFRFKTRNDPSECVVEDLLVSPADYTAVTSDPINYEALPTNGSCQVLDPDDYDYDWTLTNYGKDIVFPGDLTSVLGTDNDIDVLPNQETNAGQPALVNAGVVGFIANDTEELTVDFLDPFVTQAIPQCNTACINALVGATFNTAMTATGATGILGAHSGENNVRIFECTNEICDTFTGPAIANPVVFVNDPADPDDGLEFAFSNDLNASTYYRVMIWGGVESEPGPGQPSGVPLWGEVDSLGNPVTPLNYGNYYSWSFRTRNDASACGIGSVDVSPSQLFLNAIGERGSFSAQPFGQPDSCSLAGQELNALSYPWNWLVNTIENPLTSLDVLIATYLPDHSPTATLDTSSASLSTCTASCLNAGSGAYEAICGNGTVDQDSTTGAWEDCDPTAPGWTSVECSSTCQIIGVSACDDTITTNCCGNGIPEGREECDDGGNEDGNGCSSTCLNEGAQAAALTCGDGVTSQSTTLFPDGIHSGGEECDDGNTTSGDGCSNICLREGSINTSTIGGIECGDGVIEAGEDCDDGNADDRDGCSSSCLQEPLIGTWSFGSLNGICGNGVLEPNSPSLSGVGEECDDGNTVDGDGCSSACLNEGSSIFQATPSFCGDGVTTYSSATGGEECEVTTPDGVPAFDPVQHLEIEPVAAQTVVNGQTATTLRATGTDAETATSAFGDAVIGLNCSCENDADCGNNTARGCGLNGCCFERPEVDPANTYPLTTTTSPVCRNTLVQARFTDQMSVENLFASNDSTQPHVFVELMAAAGDWTDVNGDGVYTESADGVLGVATCPSSYLSYDFGARNNFTRFLRNLVRVFRPTAWAQTTACVIPAQLIPVNIDIGTPSVPNVVTEVSVQYAQALEPDAVYRLVVVADSDITDGDIEGMTSIWNVTMNGVSGLGIGPAGGYAGAWSNIFTTDAQICTVDEVVIEDQSASPGLLTVAGESHPLSAQAYTQNGPILEPIVKLPGLYSWDWSGTDGPLTWGWTSSIPVGTGDVVVETEVGETNIEATATAATASPAINGQEVVQSQLRIDPATDPSIDVPGRIVSGTLEETVFLCENPWPAIGNFPFADTVAFSTTNTLIPPLSLSSPFTNFSFYYCRDAGEADNTSDDLPALNIVEKTSGIEAPGVFKEFIFSVDDDENDAIGVRILANTEYQSPADWFADQGFVGAPSPETLDGFEGVRDGRTLYTSAPNVAGEIYPNMYVVAYNEGAADTTREIYNRLLAQWSFIANENAITNQPVISNNKVCTINLSTGGTDPVEIGNPPAVIACTSDADCANVDAVDDTGAPVVPFCDAEKDKLRRDYQRLSDLRGIGDALETYGENHRRCSVTKNQLCFTDADCSGAETCEAFVPTLSSGTFIPSMSTSTWPSWQAQLANELGSAVPVDPLNDYANCPDGYDPVSCYNAVDALAQCPDDSYVYNYRSIGGDLYWLEADLEYGSDVTTFPWSEPIDTFPLGDFFVGNAVLPSAPYPATGDFGGFQTAPNCQSSVVFSAANVCGDGNIGGGEVCEVGDTSTVSCSINVCTNTTDLSFNGNICTTSADCGPGGTCNATDGVQTVACYVPGENGGPGCDAYQTSAESSAACTPYFCGDGFLDEDGPDNILGNGDDEICDDGPLNGQYGFCDTSCSYSNAAFCGDGVLGGGELCDCGSSSVYAPGVPSCVPPSSSALLNGMYWADSTYGCSASCNGPQAYCGDGVVNGAEQCDGDVEQWGGALCADGEDCVEDSDCSSGSCGDGGAACPLGPNDIPQERTRICRGVISPITDSCTWPTATLGGWGSCVPTGSCGNGITEGAEECDDGNTDNNDSCLNTCEDNVCGDGIRNIGVEACDLGEDNGEACVADYNNTCTYCSNTCNFLTQSGAFCGDNVINGGEYCDGTDIPGRCYKRNADPALREIGPTCVTSADCPAGFQDCYATSGFCNGGERRVGNSPTGDLVYSYNGAPCVANSGWNVRKCGYVGVTEGDHELDGECVVQDCDSSCSQACPFTLELGSVQVQDEQSSTRTSEVDLYSYLSGPAPDEAILYFPACTVGTELIADIDFANVTPPFIDLVFLMDLSGSMNGDVSGDMPSDPGFTAPSRFTILKNGLAEGVDTLFDSFPSGFLRVALATFNGGDGASNAAPVNNGASPWITAGTELDFSTSKNDVLDAIDLLPSPADYTPIPDGLDWAYNMLNAEDPSHTRIVVLLADGAPNIDLQTTYSLADGSGPDEMDAYNVSQLLQDVLDAQVFTGAFTSSSSSQATVSHFSSNDCGTNFSSASDCVVPGNGIQYAYTSTDEDEFNEMIDAIVDAILGLNVSYVTATGSEGSAVTEGNNVTLPFPPGFSCEVNGFSGDPEPFDIPLFVSFNSGDFANSTVNLSNLRLEYCPFQ